MPTAQLTDTRTAPSGVPGASAPDERTIRMVRILPILTIHLLCLGVIFVGWSPIAVAVACALFFGRMFCITAFYHRYFSHRTFETSRPLAFVLGFVAEAKGSARLIHGGIGRE